MPRSPGAMVDVDSILLSVQERDKWRKRAEVLDHALRDVRDRRRRVESRLRRIKKELAQIRNTIDAVTGGARRPVPSDASYHASGAQPYR